MEINAFNKYQTRGAYHWNWYAENTFDYRDLVQKTLAYFPDHGSILDVGCGDALIAYQLFQQGLDVTGIDPEQVGIELGYQTIWQEYSKDHPLKIIWGRIRYRNPRAYLNAIGFRLIVASIYDFQPASPFDYALCHEVIEHVPDPEKLIEITYRSIRNYAIFTTPNGDFNKPHEHDYQFWNADQFIKLFGQKRAVMIEHNSTRLVVRLEKQ